MMENKNKKDYDSKMAEEEDIENIYGQKFDSKINPNKISMSFTHQLKSN